MSGCSSVPTVPTDLAESEVSLDDHRNTIALLIQVRDQLARLTRVRETLERPLKDAIGNAEVGTLDGVPIITWRTTSRLTLSQHAVKSRFPEIVKACQSIDTVRSFRVLR